MVVGLMVCGVLMGSCWRKYESWEDGCSFYGVWDGDGLVYGWVRKGRS